MTASSGMKAAGIFIGTIFVFSLGLNFYFATHKNEPLNPFGAHRKLDSDWEDIAKAMLCSSDGDVDAIFEALFNYDPSVNWYVSVCTDDGDIDYKEENGKVYYKKKCGYKMVVFEDKEPPSGVCDLSTTQTIIDTAVDNFEDEEDILDSIKDALKDLNLEYNFLSTWTVDTYNNITENLNSTCIVENYQVFLYLDSSDD